MDQDNVIVLINFEYEKDPSDHAIYLVPKSKVEAAKTAIETAYDKWYDADEGDIDDFINKALKKKHIPYQIAEYESVSLDLSGY